MAAPPKTPYLRMLDTHRKKLERLAERRGVRRLRDLYDAAHQSTIAKIRKTVPGRKDTFTAHQQRLVLMQVKQGQRILSRTMADELSDISREAQVESLRGVVEDVVSLSAEYDGLEPVLPIEEASRFWGVIDKRKTSLMRMHEASMQNYGAHLVGKMEGELAVSIASGETLDDAVDRIEETGDLEWWQAERIARTETSWAWSATAADGYEEAAEELPDLMMRWNEHVSDDGDPLDDRVGDDSIAMHGQVVEPGGFFVMPPETPDGKLISESLVGRTWLFPPNRPNDRSSLSPWRSGWGVPGWLYRAGVKVFL